MKKVAIVLPYLKAGGTERQALQIAAEASRYGFDATLIVIERTGQLMPLAPEGTIYLNTRFNKKNSLLILWKLAVCLFRLKPGLVVSRAWNSNILTACAAYLTSVPSILFLSGSNLFRGRSRMRVFDERIIFGTVSSFVVLCQKGRENFKKFYNTPDTKIFCIYNGVDTERIHRLAAQHSLAAESNIVNIGFMGRLLHRKGMDILLDALDRLCTRVTDLPKFVVTVIGDGEERLPLEARSQAGPLAGKVIFSGEKLNPFPFLAASDIFVLPSRAEGFPNALLEAMSLGIAPIAADCETGPSEIIHDGENGYLFPLEDFEALSFRLEALMTNPALRLKFSNAAFLTINNRFCLEQQMKNTFALFAQHYKSA